MAWSRGPGRSSGSRRDARAELTATVLGVGAVLVGLALLVMSRVTPDRFNLMRGLTLDGVSQAGSVARAPVRWLSAASEHVNGYFGAVTRNRALEDENARLAREASLADSLREENARLKRMLRLIEPARRRVAVARVAGGSAASPIDTAIISAGRGDGVAVGQPVFTDEGLMGRVIETGLTSARVLLVTDAASRIPVRVPRTGASALLSGAGRGVAELDFVSGVDLKTAVTVGDRLVTSGEGGVFPPGVPVADVTGTEGARAFARPVAKPATLGFVVVEAIWLPPPTGTVGGPPPPDQLAAEAAARAAEARAAAEKAAQEEAQRRAALGLPPPGAPVTGAGGSAAPVAGMAGGVSAATAGSTAATTAAPANLAPPVPAP